MANEGKASLLITLKDELTAGLNKAKSAMEGFTTAVLAGVGAGAALTALLGKALMDYGKQEQAVIRLDQALLNAGHRMDGTVDNLVGLAGALQKTTSFADEDIIAIEALQATFGFTEDQIKKLTPRILDLAAATGVDLHTATVALGKAIQTGSAEQLKRYGIVVDEAAFKSHDFEKILTTLDGKYEGMANRIGGSVIGQMNNLKNAFSDLMKGIGEFIAGPATKFIGWVTDAATKVSDFVAEVNKLDFAQNETGKTAESLVKIQMQEIATLKDRNAQIREALANGLAYRLTQEDVASMQAELAKNTDDLARRETALSKNQLKAGADHRDSLKKDMSVMAQKENQAHNESSADAARDAEKAREAQAESDRKAKEAAEAQALADLHAQLELQRRANFYSTMGFISSLSTAKNKELAAIGKAAAISQATIDTYAAANKALASASPPYNYILAALTVAAGLANVAKISGVKLAEGGVVMPTSGGTLATIGEAGQAEAVIPLGDPRAAAAIGGALGGGGGTHVHIHAGMLVADEMSVDHLARLIDRKLFGLERNRQSVRA